MVLFFAGNELGLSSVARFLIFHLVSCCVIVHLKSLGCEIYAGSNSSFLFPVVTVGNTTEIKILLSSSGFVRVFPAVDLIF